MVRHYKMKGQKKRKKIEEKYHKDEEEEEQQQQEEEKVEKSIPEVEQEQDISSPKKKKKIRKDEEEDETEINPELGNGFPGLPNFVSLDQKNKAGVIFVLEKASLEVAKVGKNYQLLNSDDHANFLKRNGKNPADYRPDIAHQAIVTILDSTLNKAGRLKALYVKTEKGVLIEIKPHVRIPRTFKRFAGIMLQLLQKLSITAVGRRENLLRVIKNPVTQYLPSNSRKIGFSHSSEKSVNMLDYVAAVRKDVELVFVVGAMAHGRIEPDYVDEFLSVSDYPLSAAYCISRVCGAVEQNWKVL